MVDNCYDKERTDQVLKGLQDLIAQSVASGREHDRLILTRAYDTIEKMREFLVGVTKLMLSHEEEN